MDTIQERLEKLSPQSGDLLVLAVKNPKDYLEALEAVQVDTIAIFIQPGETLECLSDEALRERGLQRIEHVASVDR